MDAKLITDVLKIVGLPGVVVIGWLVANLTDSPTASNLVMWGSGLLASIVVNFLTMRNKSATHAFNRTLTSTLNAALNPLIEVVHNMAEIDDRILDEVAEMKEIYEGGLTAKQLRFVLPKVFDSFKWRVLRICINIATPKGHTVFERKGIEDTVVAQLCGHLETLAEYNHVLQQDVIAESVRKSVAKVFDVLYAREFTDLEDYKQRVNVLMETVKTEMDTCGNAVMDLLTQGPCDLQGSTSQLGTRGH